MDTINWSDIIGHENKIKQIREMINANQFPNAVIFSGISGIGKRRIARTVAAALLCENKDGPCGKCPSCRTFTANSNPDYYCLEPDRSKANPIIKIEQIREMQKEVILMPASSNCRMVIIDDAECMNNVSQNCLLKTIEEPQGFSKFILITSNLSRLLMTLRSRCMIIKFEHLKQYEIEQTLKTQDVNEAEKVAIIANGSLGQAIDLAKNNGLKIREDSLNFLESVSKLSIEDIFIKGQELSAFPKEYFNQWTVNLQKFLRDILILGNGIENQYFYNVDLTDRLQSLKNNFVDNQIFSMIHETTEAQRRLKSNMTLQLLIETFLIRFKRSLDNNMEFPF